MKLQLPFLVPFLLLSLLSGYPISGKSINVQENYREGIFKRAFGLWSIDEELFYFILNILPKNKTLLELGSGWVSGQLSRYYTTYSIEHDTRWLNKYATHYIYAPIKNGWYDTDVLSKKLPGAYDLILVDGPPGRIGRDKFYDNLALFNTNVPIIFDDVNRSSEYELMEKVARKLGREFEVFNTSSDKQFGVILPDAYILRFLK